MVAGWNIGRSCSGMLKPCKRSTVCLRMSLTAVCPVAGSGSLLQPSYLEASRSQRRAAVCGPLQYQNPSAAS